VTTPPVLYTYATDDWVDEIRQLSAAVRTSDGSAAGIRTIVAAHAQITHIYASERSPTLKPSQLMTAPWLEVVYQAGDVTLFRVKRPLDD
jgi:prophage DNA circulation protein